MKEKIVEFIQTHKVKILIVGLIAVGSLIIFLAGFVQGCRCGS